MGRFSGYLLACDMDGTLVSSGVIPQRNIDAIRMFTQEGGTFALATGRGPTAVSHALEKVGEYVGPSVVANGCMIYDYSKNEILMQKEIDNNFKEFVIKSAELFDEIGIEVHAEAEAYLLKGNSETLAHETYESFVAQEAPISEYIDKKWNKVLSTCEDISVSERQSDYLRENCKGAKVIHTTAEIDGVLRHYFELIPDGVSKASAIKELCEMLNIEKGKFVAIGDYFNDFEMLSFADVAACPKGSPEEIVKICDFVGGSVLDGAVADFIEYLYNGGK